MRWRARLRRFVDGEAICWGRYLYCWPRMAWVRVGCDSTGKTCCAPESLPRGTGLPGASRVTDQDMEEFKRLCERG